MKRIEFNRVRQMKPTKNQIGGFRLFASKPAAATETRYKYISPSMAINSDGGVGGGDGGGGNAGAPIKNSWSTFAAAKRFDGKLKIEHLTAAGGSGGGGVGVGKAKDKSSEECVGGGSDGVERIDVYYLDHGNCDYFATTDCPPQLRSERLAQQTIDWSTKFWAEIYGSIYIVVAFIIAFVLQTFRFVMYGIVRPLLIGTMQIVGDYLLKPLLAIVFNGFVQPPLILVLNIFVSVRDICKPIAETLQMFCQPFSDCLRSIRLVEIHPKRGGGGDKTILTTSKNDESAATLANRNIV